MLTVYFPLFFLPNIFFPETLFYLLVFALLNLATSIIVPSTISFPFFPEQF
jgi:hypothetical protein